MIIIVGGGLIWLIFQGYKAKQQSPEGFGQEPRQETKTLNIPNLLPIQPPANEVVPDSQSATEENNAAIEITADYFHFQPKEIRLKKDQQAELVIRNSGVHTFTIEKLGINQFMNESKEYKISIPANQKEEFEFYCAIPGHYERGMRGKLIIQ